MILCYCYIHLYHLIILFIILNFKKKIYDQIFFRERGVVTLFFLGREIIVYWTMISMHLAGPPNCPLERVHREVSLACWQQKMLDYTLLFNFCRNFYLEG